MPDRERRRILGDELEPEPEADEDRDWIRDERESPRRPWYGHAGVRWLPPEHRMRHVPPARPDWRREWSEREVSDSEETSLYGYLPQDFDRPVHQRGAWVDRGLGDTDEPARHGGRPLPRRRGDHETPVVGGDRAPAGLERPPLLPRPHRGKGPRGYRRSDQRIREDVCERLTAHTAVDPSDVDVQVDGGEIYLAGTVAHRPMKHLIEDIAADVPGVREVRNDIRVRRPV